MYVVWPMAAQSVQVLEDVRGVSVLLKLRGWVMCVFVVVIWLPHDYPTCVWYERSKDRRLHVIGRLLVVITSFCPSFWSRLNTPPNDVLQHTDTAQQTWDAWAVMHEIQHWWVGKRVSLSSRRGTICICILSLDAKESPSRTHLKHPALAWKLLFGQTGCLQKFENHILLPFTTFYYLSSMKIYYLLTALLYFGEPQMRTLRLPNLTL